MSDQRLLKGALLANAAFSTCSGAASLLFADALGEFLGGIPGSELMGLGVGLLGFAGFVFWLSRRDVVPAALGWGVVAGDVAWVLATVPIVASDALSRGGDWLALGIADVVLLFAILQGVGLWRSRSLTGSAAEATS
ncbi:MAG: hypothetical protein AAF430_02740 [Myxococcota bacterium]